MISSDLKHDLGILSMAIQVQILTDHNFLLPIKNPLARWKTFSFWSCWRGQDVDAIEQNDLINSVTIIREEKKLIIWCQWVQSAEELAKINAEKAKKAQTLKELIKGLKQLKVV